MINAQAVLAQLVKLGALRSNDDATTPHLAEADWLQGELQGMSLEHQQDAAGNHWITLAGAESRSVVLGAYLQESGTQALDSQVELVAGLEILRAVSKRVDGRPPCTLHLVVWAPGQPQERAAALQQKQVGAYLELHVEAASDAAAPLGVVLPDGDRDVFNPRLMTLCDEAIRELTGTSAASPSSTARAATAIAQAGIATAVMSVRGPAGQAAAEDRVHLLEAAEAFGRWTESAMHLVAGEPVDLWAREQRVPHTGS
ncbi:MAG: hypothetical protein ACRYF4_00920 [Janthinobacterium lividum]